MRLRLWDGNTCIAQTSLDEDQCERLHSSGILLFVDDYYTFQGFYDGYCNFAKVEQPVAVEHWFI